jgi:hypothetical protein
MGTEMAINRPMDLKISSSSGAAEAARGTINPGRIQRILSMELSR